MPYSHFFYLLLLGTSLLLNSCGGPSASKYAKTFCDCSEDLAKATIQLKAGTITQAEFSQIAADHSTCLGEKDPLELLKDDPEALAQFKQDFLLELENQCPKVAQGMGF